MGLDLAGGSMLLFFHQKKMHKDSKNDLEQCIENGKLEIFTLHRGQNTNWIWTKKNEFWHNGELYDVVKIEISKDSIVHYYCFNDSHESNFLLRIFPVFKNKKTPDWHSGKIIRTWLELFSEATQLVTLPLTPRFGYSFACVWPFSVRYNPPPQEITAPPPK